MRSELVWHCGSGCLRWEVCSDGNGRGNSGAASGGLCRNCRLFGAVWSSEEVLAGLWYLRGSRLGRVSGGHGSLSDAYHRDIGCERGFAIQRKAPTILFLVCGIFPLVPGAAIYYTAYNFFMGQEALALQYGMDTIKMAIAIGLGIGAAYSLPGHLFGWKREIEVWEPGKEGKK